MSLSDYLPSPQSGWEALTTPFKSRDGKPWLQSTARNLGHAAFGDEIGGYVDQKFLGDASAGQLGPQSGMAAQMQAQVTPTPSTQMTSQQAQSAMAVMQQLMKHKGGQ